MLGAVSATFTANELESPEVPQVLPGHQACTHEIDEVTIQRRTVVGEMREHLDEISMRQRRVCSFEPL